MKSDIDYIEFYAKSLLKDNSNFVQQKLLINSQLKASISLFANKFGKGKEFEKNARIYLKEIGLI